MAINFCLSQYRPAISCKQIAADDHDVSNLISSNPQKLRRGFRVEHFINPPIEIIVRFPSCVDVSHIVLGLRSGPQQVSAVKLFSEYPRINGKRKWDFQFIGKCENVNSRKVHFQNSHYTPREPFTKTLVNSDVSLESDVLRLTLKSDINISSIQKLKVCLTKIANSGVAVLAELQVWGQPSRVCDAKLIENIFNISYPSQPSEASAEENHVKSTTSSESIETVDSGDVPSEFLDSITHEIMSLPMVLPSGNIVDQQTIEKWKNAQEIYGRTAVDPFTGIPFHGENHPVFNAALKARIDEFLVKKCLNVPRSIGTHENIRHKVYKSSLYSNNPSNSKVQSGIVEWNSQPGLKTLAQEKPRGIRESVKDGDKKKSHTAAPLLKTIDILNHDHQGASSYDELPLEKICEAKRKESLKAALEDILGTVRRFTNFSKAEEPQRAKCIACSCEFAHSTFQLPCTHIICRSCMTSKLKTSSSPACNACNTAFTSESVERVFL